MRTAWFRLALRIKAIRQVPNGMCRRCAGTGSADEVIDLGDSRSQSSAYPIRMCGSCTGTGMATAHVEITSVGLLLVCLVPLAIWVLPAGAGLMLAATVALVSVAAVRGNLGKSQPSPYATEVPTIRTPAREVAVGPGSAGPTTAGVLTLIDAIETRTQTVDPRESGERLEPATSTSEKKISR